MIEWLEDLWHNVSNAYWNVRNGLIQVRRYGRLIWNNRDWDFCFLLDLLEAKFRWMAVECGDLGHHVGSEREGKQLRVCAELCRRIREDSYYRNLTGPVEYKQWFEDKEDHSIFHSECYKDGVLMTWDERRVLYKQAEKARQNDLEYLTTLMRKHLLGWWD